MTDDDCCSRFLVYNPSRLVRRVVGGSPLLSGDASESSVERVLRVLLDIVTHRWC